MYVIGNNLYYMLFYNHKPFQHDQQIEQPRLMRDVYDQCIVAANISFLKKEQYNCDF